MDIGEVNRRVKRLARNFEKELVGVIAKDSGMFVDYVHEQLFAGVNGRGKPLRPTYLTDPYFKEEYGENWKGAARGYMEWKWEKSYPKMPSWLGFQPRKKETPNLIITGEFYYSIYADKTAKGLEIGTRGTTFGGDVEKKYGSVIFGITPAARRHYMENRMNSELVRIFKKYTT